MTLIEYYNAKFVIGIITVLFLPISHLETTYLKCLLGRCRKSENSQGHSLATIVSILLPYMSSPLIAGNS